MKKLWDKIRSINLFQFPVHLWIFTGFFIPYFLFFVKPIFLDSEVMQFPKYIPSMNPIGEDLRQMLTYSDSWYIQKQTPYIGKNLYPPAATLLFTPLLSLNYYDAYKFITIINITLFFLISLILPYSLIKNKHAPTLLMLFFLSGLFSYGFQFELERGQFNIVAISSCLLAIWIYHRYNHLRILAYFFFIFSVQLKIYPLIFIVLLIRDWRDWKSNIFRTITLVSVNFVMFFIFGKGVFLDFITAIKAQAIKPSVWIGNHSIHSFFSCSVSGVGLPNYNCANQGFMTWEFMTMAVIGVLIFLIMLKSYTDNYSGINPILLLACTIGALVIPSVSHDYTLSFLVAPVTIVFMDIEKFVPNQKPLLRLFKSFLILIFSAVYASTLFSYANKPNSIGLLYQNNFPALFIMLIIITFLYLTPGKDLNCYETKHLAITV